jgi:hypothetical protein
MAVREARGEAREEMEIILLILILWVVEEWGEGEGEERAQQILDLMGSLVPPDLNVDTQEEETTLKYQLL